MERNPRVAKGMEFIAKMVGAMQKLGPEKVEPDIDKLVADLSSRTAREDNQRKAEILRSIQKRKNNGQQTENEDIFIEIFLRHWSEDEK
jgi:Asp-tRNA(Asn)/Glu-tRNA(Gln) amidotransferase C subunit